jgi:hypothetical protein
LSNEAGMKRRKEQEEERDFSPMNFHSLKEESRTIKMRDSNSEIFNVFYMIINL